MAESTPIPDRRERTRIAVAAGVDERTVHRFYTEPKAAGRSESTARAILAAIDAAGAPRPEGL